MKRRKGDLPEFIEMRLVKKAKIRARCMAVETYSQAALNGIRAMERAREAIDGDERNG